MKTMLKANQMQITKNFSLHELTKSETAIRNGIDNTPDDEAIRNLTLLARNVLQPIRDAWGPVKVNSAYRGPRVNSIIGGSKNSDHMRGMAADIEVTGISNADVALWIEKRLPFRQLILEFYQPGVPDSGWVHVSYDENDLKQQSLTAIRENGKTVYLAGLIT